MGFLLPTHSSTQLSRRFSRKHNESSDIGEWRGKRKMGSDWLKRVRF